MNRRRLLLGAIATAPLVPTASASVDPVQELKDKLQARVAQYERYVAEVAAKIPDAAKS